MKPDTAGLNFLMGVLSQRDRMDQVTSRNKASVGSGDGESRSERIEKGFKSVYHRVARNNAKALDRSEERDPVLDTDSRMEKGNEVIRSALISLTDKLDLDLNPALSDLSITSFSEEMLEQLSEILHSLKGIAGMLDGAVANGQALDTGNGVISVAEAQRLSSFIHSALFKVEMGIGMLGVADHVAATLAIKQDRAHQANILQALDPSQLTMPHSHQAKISGSMPFGSLEGVSLLVQKIRELCANVAQGQSVQVTGLVSSSSDAGASLSTIDSQTMRRMLNIDSQNTDAARQNEKLGLPFAGDKVFAARNLTEKAVKPTEQSLLAGDALGRQAKGPMGLAFAAGAASTLFRSMDETITSQLADKLQKAVRSGVTEVRLHLRPEALGEVKMKIRVEKGLVTAKIEVESQQVKQTVENNLSALRDSLSAQNLETGALEVSVSEEGHQGMTDALAHDEQDRENEEGKQASDDDAIALGQETGKRYGDNSVEYFG